MKNNVLILNNHCCGCGQCVVMCPTSAIILKKNRQGFYYPNIDNDKCVNCGKCVRDCSFNNHIVANKVLDSFAVKHLNDNIRFNSRSGGVFTSISDWVFDKHGVVYGCSLVNHNEAIHTRAITKNERDSFRGSKYIQSNIIDCYQSVMNDLSNNKWVLFSGTPCQVNAIKSYCKNIDTERLILLDIVCHGVPSPLVWSDYLSYLSGKSKRIVSVDFRDKKRFGWAAHKETIEFDNGEVYSSSIFTELFYSHLIIRKECFECPFKHITRLGDITIADCWGIAENYPNFDDDKGVSLVLLNSLKGKSIWRQVENIDSISVDLRKLMQPPLYRNWEKPHDYNDFWEFYYSHSLKKVINKYVYKTPTLNKRVINRLKRMTVQVLRKG